MYRLLPAHCSRSSPHWKFRMPYYCWIIVDMLVNYYSPLTPPSLICPICHLSFPSYDLNIVWPYIPRIFPLSVCALQSNPTKRMCTSTSTSPWHVICSFKSTPKWYVYAYLLWRGSRVIVCHYMSILRYMSSQSAYLLVCFSAGLLFCFSACLLFCFSVVPFKNLLSSFVKLIQSLSFVYVHCSLRLQLAAVRHIWISTSHVTNCSNRSCTGG